MAHGWSIGGRRLELGAAFPAGKIVAREQGAVVFEKKLPRAGQLEAPLGGQTFTVRRTSGFMGPKTEVFDARGRRIPPSARPIQPGPAPLGSSCATHQVGASYACARCGTFVCVDCAGADLTHCEPCLQRLNADADKNAAALAYMAPVVVMGALGGLLLAVLGLAAGGAAVAIAKKVESKPLKLVAAVALYGAAVVIWLAILVTLQR